MARKGKSGSYTIGFSKPPREHQFKKGAPSPNPKGRPKKTRKSPAPDAAGFGSLRLDTIFLEEAYRPVSVLEGNKTVETSTMQVIARAISVKAAKGDRHAQRMVVERVSAIEAMEHRLLVSYNEELMKYKARWTEVINEARAAGHPEPVIIPHPDDILVDHNTGKVGIYGPKTKEEKDRLDKFIAQRDKWQKEIQLIRNEWKKASSEDKSDWLLYWHDAQKTFDTMNDNLPPRYRVQLDGRCPTKSASMPGSQARIPFPENALVHPEFGVPPDQVQTAASTDMGSTRRRRSRR